MFVLLHFKNSAVGSDPTVILARGGIPRVEVTGFIRKTGIVILRIGQIFQAVFNNLFPLKPFPVYWRMVVEELGGGIIKLAQILALRYEILPAPYAKEFSLLFDQVKPIASEEVRVVFQKEFGKNPEDIFARFEYKVYASASFGQIHKAFYQNRPVAIKVQKPQAESRAKADLILIKFLAKIGDFLFTAPVSLKEAITEWEQWTIREFDYRLEAENAKRLKKINPDSAMYVPEVFSEVSTDRILVTEFLPGENLNQIIYHGARELSLGDRLNVARHIVRNLLFNYFKGGFFHADPHPGNIILAKDGRLAWVDFGIMGESGPLRQNLHFANFIKFASEELTTKAVSHFREVVKDSLFGKTNPDDLWNDLEKYNWSGVSGKKIEKGINKFLENKLGGVIEKWAGSVGKTEKSLLERSSARHFLILVQMARRFGMDVPLNLLSFIRATVITDMLCFMLNPEFDMKKELRSFFLDHPEVCENQNLAIQETTINKETNTEVKNTEKQKLVEKYIEYAFKIIERMTEEGVKLASLATTKL